MLRHRRHGSPGKRKKKRSNRILHRLSSEPIFALGPRYCIVPLRYIRFRRQNYATYLSLSDCVDLQWSGVFWELWKLNGVNWEDTLSKLLTGSKHPVSSVSSFFCGATGHTIREKRRFRLFCKKWRHIEGIYRYVFVIEEWLEHFLCRTHFKEACSRKLVPMNFREIVRVVVYGEWRCAWREGGEISKLEPLFPDLCPRRCPRQEKEREREGDRRE